MGLADLPEGGVKIPERIREGAVQIQKDQIRYGARIRSAGRQADN